MNPPNLTLILSDINKPVMDGLELLREIKARRPDLPVMMVTAYGDDERRRLAGEYGAARVHHQAGRLRFPEDPASRSVRRRRLTTPALPRMAASKLSWRPHRRQLRGIFAHTPRRQPPACRASKPDLYAAGELRTLPVIRLRRRDQQGSRHIPSGRSASSTDAFPRKVNGFLTPFAILCARKASTESPLWLHLKSRQ